MSVRLNLVVAHKLESEALVRLFKLRQEGTSPLVYTDGEAIRLIVSGEGSAASATAVNFLSQSYPESAPQAWLNLGIAGHQSKELGESVVIQKLVQVASGAVHYPIPMLSQCPFGELHTVDQPEFEYPHDVAYDMEGFGFYAAAIQHTTIELVQCCKIISDNRQQDANTVTADLVRELFTANLPQIQEIVAMMIDLQKKYQGFSAAPPELQAIDSKYHLTATQKVQVRRLLHRLHAFDRQHELNAMLDRKNLDGRKLVRLLTDALREAG